MKSQHSHVTSNAVRIVQIASILAAGLLLTSCRNPARDAELVNGQRCVYERVTGSNLPERVCRTPEEWEVLAAREREGAEQGLDNLQDLQEYEGFAPGGAPAD